MRKQARGRFNLDFGCGQLLHHSVVDNYFISVGNYSVISLWEITPSV